MGIERIPKIAIHEGKPYRDGEIITGTMVNEVVKILKDGVNYNKFFIDAMFAGSTEEAIVIGVPKGEPDTTAQDIVKLKEFIADNSITVVDGQKAFVFRCIYGNVDDPTEITGVQALNYFKYVTNDWFYQYAVSMDTFIQGLSSDFTNYPNIVEPSLGSVLVVQDDNVLHSVSLQNIKNVLGVTELLEVTVPAIEQDIAEILDGTQTVKKAEQDESGNVITTTYETKADATSKKSEIDGRLVTAESEITKIKDGTTIVKKAEQDASGNVITSTYETKSVVSGINSRVTSLETQATTIYDFKGSVAFESLPTTGQKVGDTYNITNNFTLGGQDYLAGTNVAWNGTTWDALASRIPNASEIDYDNTVSGMTATTVQDAIDELSDLVENIGLDDPVSELNNKSLREVFEGGNLILNGDFSDGATGWGTNSNLVVTDEIGRFIGLGNSDIIVIAPTINGTIQNAKYYLSANVKYDGNITALWLRTVGSVDNEILALDTITLNSWRFLSAIGTLTTSTLGIQVIGFYPNSTAQLNNSIYVDNMTFINMSTLGISSLTVAQMDYWFEVYKRIKDNGILAQVETKEKLANKATDFSVLNDTKYPTTKAVSERLLNLPITELNNHTLREVFESIPFVTPISIIGTDTITNITNGYRLTYGNDTNFYHGISKNILTNGDKYYLSYIIKPFSTHFPRIFIGGTPFTFSNSAILNVNTKYSHIFVSTGNQLVLYANGSSSGNFLGSSTDFTNIYITNQTTFGISSLTVAQMDYWFNVYQALLVSDTNAIFSLFKTLLDTKANMVQEAWLTPTLTGATSTYIRYRKDTLGTVIVEGNITVTTAGTNLTLPVGYRPLFAYTVGILTFNTDGTVVSSATGTQTLSVRYTGA